MQVIESIGAPEERKFKLFARYPRSLERISRSACTAASPDLKPSRSHDDCRSDLSRTTRPAARVRRVQAKLPSPTRTIPQNQARAFSACNVTAGRRKPGRLLIGFLPDKVFAPQQRAEANTLTAKSCTSTKTYAIQAQWLQVQSPSP
jgi:hypothetical protein